MVCDYGFIKSSRMMKFGKVLEIVVLELVGKMMWIMLVGVGYGP